MSLIILDPNFAHPHGHHMEFDLAVAAAAREREQEVIIFAHRDCPVAGQHGIEIIPVFSHSTYESKHPDPIVGRFDDFTYFNDTLAGELALIPRDRLRAADAVLVPTLTENHLLGYVSWMRTFDAARAPLFALYLMFPSGLGAANESGTRTVADPLQALFYRLAFRRASEPGPAIHFFGAGRQLASEFSALTGATIEPHPIPYDPRSRKSRPGTGKLAALLFAGDVKVDKGFTLIPELADRLCVAFPDWDFLIHANAGSSWGPALEAYHALTGVAPPQNLILQTGRLTRADYLELVDRADCVVSTYDPAVYARKSSGVVWEAISLGLPMLVPADTWLEREAREWGAGYGIYTEYSVEAIFESFREFSQALPTLVTLSLEAAERYRAHNGVGALLDQLGRLWAPRMLAARLVVPPSSSFLPLEDIDEEGWSFPETLEGGIVRRVGCRFDIGFSWPFNVPWRVEVDAARCSDAGQIRLARAFADGRELPTSAQVHEAGSSGILTIAGSGDRHRPAVRVRIELPSAPAAGRDSRQLGMLIRSVHVAPAETAEGIARTGQIELFTRVKNDEHGAIILDRVVSGRALMNPHADNWLHFTADTRGGPEAARAIEVYVNGIPLRVDRFAMGNNRWALAVRCGTDILGAVDYWADWDLVLRSDTEARVCIAGLFVSESGTVPEAAVEGFHHPARQEPRGIAQPAPSRESEALPQPPTTVSEAAEVGRQGRRETLLTATSLAEASAGFYHLEYGDKGAAFRWTGPEPESTFTVGIDRTHPVLLKFRILSLGKNQLADLAVEVDGDIYPLRDGEPKRVVYVAGPLKVRPGHDATRVTLRVAHLIRPAGDAASDKRTLGIAIGWIRAHAADMDEPFAA